jgi:hypothetical protein
VNMRPMMRSLRPLPQLLPARRLSEPGLNSSPFFYTNPEGLQAAFDLGRRDADTFIRECTERERAPDRVACDTRSVVERPKVV